MARQVRTTRSSAGGDAGWTDEIDAGSRGHDRRDERGLVRAREGLLAGRHLVQHGAEGEDVRARVGFLAFELLGRHVLERAEDRALLRQVGLGRQGRLARLRLRRFHRLGQAEVEQLDARPRQHHVAGLEVPVHDPLPVRLIERVRDLDAVAQRLVQRKRSLREAIRQRLAFEVLHDEILGVALAPDVVERADVRVRELRDRLRLPLEALAHFGGRRQVLREHLDGHGPLEPRVLRLVHLSHAARAERREDLVRAEPCSRGERHVNRSPPGDDLSTALSHRTQESLRRRERERSER